MERAESVAQQPNRSFFEERQMQAGFQRTGSSRAFSERQFLHMNAQNSLNNSIRFCSQYRMSQFQSAFMIQGSLPSRIQSPSINSYAQCASYQLQATEVSILQRELSGLGSIISKQQSIVCTRRRKVDRVRQVRKICEQKKYELLEEVETELQKADKISKQMLVFTEHKMSTLFNFHYKLKQNYENISFCKWEEQSPSIKNSEKMDKIGVVKATIDIGCDSLNIYLHVEMAKVYPVAIAQQFRMTWEKTEQALTSTLKDVYNQTSLTNISLQKFAKLQARMPLSQLLEVEKNLERQMNKAEKVINEQQTIIQLLMQGSFRIIDMYLSSQQLKMNPDAVCHFTCAWMQVESLGLVTQERLDNAVEYYFSVLSKMQRLREMLRAGY